MLTGKTYQKSITKLRNMKIRSHDDMLEEEYSQLRMLLDDSQNYDREELRDRHTTQTFNLIDNYTSMNQGRKTKAALISRSLPSELRTRSPPTSARSSTSTSLSRSSSPTFRKVSFMFSNSSESDIGVRNRQRNRKQRYSSSGEQSTKPDSITFLSPQAKTNKERLIGVQLRPGVIEGCNGLRHSDNNLKSTQSPDIKKWLHSKEKLIKKDKKESNKKKKEELAEEERKAKEKEERRIESNRKMKEWRRKKRKEALLERRRKHPTKNNKINDGQSKDKDIRLEQHQPRPKSAPVTRTRIKQTKTDGTNVDETRSRQTSTRKSEISIAKLIAENPDLQDKLKHLERQRKLKHRQSYEDWCKAKDKEKKNSLRAVREQRLKLEQEISEETVRVISEAAQRRMDSIRYKRPAKKKESSTGSTKESDRPTGAAPYSWRDYGSKGEGNEREKRTNDEKQKPREHTTMPKVRPDVGVKKTSHIEDKISDNIKRSQDPFKSKQKGRGQRPKSNLEQSGINGPHFSQFIWNLVNDQENGDRPEPQGEDSASSKVERESSVNGSGTEGDRERRESKLNFPVPPRESTSPAPPNKSSRSPDGKETSHPILETGTSIFAMTSIE